MWHTGNGMGWWMLFGSLMWLALIGLIAYLVVRVSGAPTSRSIVHRQPEESDAVEITRRRYANGELTRDEFVRINEDLTKTAA